MARSRFGVVAPVSSTVESPAISNNVVALLTIFCSLAGIVFLMIEPYKVIGGYAFMRFNQSSSRWLMDCGLCGSSIGRLSTLSGGLLALLTLRSSG